VSDTLPSLAERANAPLPLDTFVLEQAVLEIRYDNAYIFWDRSGRLWQEMVKAEEDLRPLETQPNRTSFAIARDYQLSANIESSRVNAYFPNRDLQAFMQKCDAFFQIVLGTLDVDGLRRVGLRLIYSREYPRITDAAKAIRSLNLVVLPQGKHFGIESSAPRPE
jgi:hypothetical protein